MPTHYRYAPVHLSVQYGFSDVTQTLVTAGCDLDLCTSNGMSVLQLSEHVGDNFTTDIIRSKIKTRQRLVSDVRARTLVRTVVRMGECIVYTRDINDAELLMPSRDYWFLMPSRDFHFRRKNETRPSRDSNKTCPSRVDTLGN